MVAASLLCGILTGRINEITAAALTGVRDAAEFLISIAGIMCLWTGVLEVMNRSGLSKKLARVLNPILSKLFPGCSNRPDAMQAISANVSANLLGLGNAATPYGVRAAEILSGLSGGNASDDLCMLVVVNSASLQLIPATVAGIRQAAGAARPFDILPAVWITTACALFTGIGMAKLFARLNRSKRPGRS
jgi:spore maturation protein A